MLDTNTHAVEIEGCRTTSQLFRLRAKQLGSKTALREKELGIWHDYSWADYYDAARIYGAALLKTGFDRGDVLSIIAEPIKEWVFFDMAVQALGGIANGIYTTDAPEQVEYICADSRTRYLVVENEEQLDKWLETRDRLDFIEKVILLDDKGLKEFRDPKVVTIADFTALGRAALDETEAEWNRRIDETDPEDTVLLVYTSGTTGKPKGAMLSHRNLLWGIDTFVRHFELTGDETSVSYLPLCHVIERGLSVFASIRLGSTVNFIEAADTAFENIAEVSPTYILGVPRIWEKMYSAVTLRMKDATFVGKAVFDWAFRQGQKRVELQDEGKPLPPVLKLKVWLADKLVFHNTRVMLGLDRARTCLTGAAPISPDLIQWLRALGLNVFEGYGQTESSGAASANRRDAYRIGSIGRHMKGLEMTLAEDGEILLRGPMVFKGYLNQPEKTAETIIDGWLHTGDVGRVDNDGFFYITDRKKDIIITAGGKNITPSEIENEIKFSPYVSDAVVIGDRRKFLTSLIMIDHENVAQFAQDLNVPFTDFESLCRAPEVQDLIRAEIERANAKFARVETVKDFRIIEKELTAEDDELTATMKLKRAFVEKAYSDLIESMYGG